MFQNAAKFYQSVDKESMSGRETEARVLTQGALKLKDFQKIIFNAISYTSPASFLMARLLTQLVQSSAMQELIDNSTSLYKRTKQLPYYNRRHYY